MVQAIPNRQYLLHRIADRLDEHPVREWSEPLLTAFLGLLDAHALSTELAHDAIKVGLHLVDPVKPAAELVDENVVSKVI